MPSKFNRAKLFNRSRDRDFLLKSAALIVAASVAIGWIVSAVTFGAGLLPFMLGNGGGYALEMTEIAMGEAEPGIEEFAEWVRQPRSLVAPYEVDIGEQFRPNSGGDTSDTNEADREEKSVVGLIEKSIAESEKIDASERKLLTDLLHAYYGEKPAADEAVESLRSASAMEPPRRFASEFLGDALDRRHDYAGAIDAFAREAAAFPETRRPRAEWLRLLRQEKRTDDLRAALADPANRAALDPGSRMEIATELRDWKWLVLATVAHDFHFPSPGLALLCLLSGTIWAIVVTQFSGYDRPRLVWYGLALVLGFFSATATLVAVEIQENIRGFTHHPDDTLFNQVIYCVAGIGLREEGLKLLFFLPLLPWLLRRGTEVDALVVAGLTGLGFAINENVGYAGYGDGFEMVGGMTIWSRFLSATFFHAALTGVAGLAMYRLFRWRGKRWENALYDLLIVIVVHGAYDAVLMVPPFAEYSWTYLLFFAFSAYLFLDHMTHLSRPPSSLGVSPLGVFVWGSALLLGAIFVFGSWAMPFSVGFFSFLAVIASEIPFMFVFINRLREI